jgi:hypothetical protein
MIKPGNEIAQKAPSVHQNRFCFRARVFSFGFLADENLKMVI